MRSRSRVSIFLKNGLKWQNWRKNERKISKL